MGFIPVLCEKNSHIHNIVNILGEEFFDETFLDEGFSVLLRSAYLLMTTVAHCSDANVVFKRRKSRAFDIHFIYFRYFENLLKVDMSVFTLFYYIYPDYPALFKYAV